MVVTHLFRPQWRNNPKKKLWVLLHLVWTHIIGVLPSVAISPGAVICLKMLNWVTNSVDPNQMSQNVASDPSQQCLVSLPVSPNTLGYYGKSTAFYLGWRFLLGMTSHEFVYFSSSDIEINKLALLFIYAFARTTWVSSAADEINS